MAKDSEICGKFIVIARMDEILRPTYKITALNFGIKHIRQMIKKQ